MRQATHEAVRRTREPFADPLGLLDLKEIDQRVQRGVSMAARDAFRAAECPGPKLAAAAGRTPYAAKGGSRAVGVNFCQTSGVSQFCRKPCLRG
jgi:hypothetical protein